MNSQGRLQKVLMSKSIDANMVDSRFGLTLDLSGPKFVDDLFIEHFKEQ